MERPVATEQAPPAQPPKQAPSSRDGIDAAPAGDIRSTSPYFPLQGAIRRGASVIALIALDLVGLVLGVYAALTLRALVYGSEVSQWGLRWKVETDWLPFLTVITVLVFWRAGLYAERERRAGFGRIVASLVLVAVVTLIFAVGTGHEFGTYGLAPTAVVLTAIFIGLLRGSYDVITGDLLKFAGIRRRAILVGTGESLARLRRSLGASRGGIDYDFVGAISTSSDVAGLQVLGKLSSLPAVLATRDVDELIVTDSDFSDRELVEIVEQAHRRGVKVRVAPRASEILMERRGEYVPGQGIPLFELRPPVFVGADWVVKRGFDLAVSAIIAIIGLPIWLLIALAIKLETPGPVLYRDRRVGLNEREFDMLKFRTMRADAEALQAQLEKENEAEGALFKIRDDPRVTRVGRVLRRFSLDEIPQVLNVLRGEMSLVGPRPLPVRDYELLEPWHRKRYLVLPGMTGLWQVAGRSSLGFDDLVRLDFYYLEHWSIWLDISILLKTLPAVLAARGAY
jgi:exopolysaccharide biosynthesis polyprenyl glycosylphosphotransferase